MFGISAIVNGFGGADEQAAVRRATVRSANGLDIW